MSLVRCANPGLDKSGRMDITCVSCERRSVKPKDGEPVMCGRFEPGGFCQDRVPPQYVWVPGWIKKP